MAFLRECEYASDCKEFIRSLNVPDSFFNNKQSRCYCRDRCFAWIGTHLKRGEPQQEYHAPKGWYRQGIVVPPQTWALRAFPKWHRAYHGTDPQYVNWILDTGSLLMPGDETLGGHTISYQPNHFNPDNKPEGADLQRMFCTPSITYAGLDVYSKPKSNRNGKEFTAKTALQVLIEPGSYDVSPMTVARGPNRIDENFSDDVLEWSTKRRGSIIIYGLLVKLISDGADPNEERSCRIM